MYILGLSCYYHNSSAALLKDGVPVSAAAEERFTRKKHDASFPLNAVRYCLQSQNITIKDINYISYYEKPLLKFERVLFQHLHSFPRSYKTFLTSTPSWLNEKLRIIKTLRKKLKYAGDVFFVEHHLAHAAGSFFVSPFEEAAIVTADGVGEWTTTTYGIGENNQIHLQKEIRFPHSLGLLYSAVTTYLGFRANNDEFKVMGLSSYGNQNPATNPFYQKLCRVIDIKEDGSFLLDMNYFVFHWADHMFSKKLCQLLGGTARTSGNELTQRHQDIAAALQTLTEEALYKIMNHAYTQTRCENLVLAGGVALNSVANGKVLAKTPFDRLWLQPAAGDGGASLGAALYTYHSILEKPRQFHLKNAFLGPVFTTAEIKKFLENNIKYTTFASREKLLETTARLIYENKIIGWFQGQMEWGPRALGNRSILANPCNPHAQDELNRKVKHREPFRPFAPVVCKEDVATFFETDTPLPEPVDFMLLVYPIKKQWRSKIPSVTHFDGTGRLQAVSHEQNPLYFDLIKEFGKLSGIPMLINTSFNIRGEPIVCTPADAYKCMMGTGIDYLVIDKFLVKRNDNPLLNYLYTYG